MQKDDQNIELGLISQSGEPTNGAQELSRCSFCGRSAADVTCLLSGANAMICDDCISRYKQELKADL
jgi:hypothetical protein